MCRVVFISIFICSITACETPIERDRFSFILDEPTIVWNIEQDNSMEGEYLTVDSLVGDHVYMKLPQDFYISNTNNENWIFGFGSNSRYHDNGSENLYEITRIENNLIVLGNRIKGKDSLEINETICFWRKGPKDFAKCNALPLINVKLWPDFVGESVHMGFIVFDSISMQYIMYFNEVDQDSVSIYAAGSKNLLEWYPINEGKPFYTSADFHETTWSGWDSEGEKQNSPFISDALFHDGSWHLFLSGFNKEGERSIGIIQTKSLLQKGKIQKEASIGPSEFYDAKGAYYPKVTSDKGIFYMAYDGVSRADVEKVCMARSGDLIHWQKMENNPVISDHKGWRSSFSSSEPNFLSVKGDSILIMVSGTKAFKDNLWERRITGRSWMDVPGNVADAQLGVYISTDGGITFKAHKDNPIMINDYSDDLENEHMGGNIEFIRRDSFTYIIYQAKSLHYNLHLRKKPTY